VAPAAVDQTSTELIAVIVAVTDDEPRVLTIDNARALPSGPFQTTDRSLQSSLRTWVERQTHHPLGYMEQLYTFADRDRMDDGRHAISISYLGLTREALSVAQGSGAWVGWYRYFPWEERRQGRSLVHKEIASKLEQWAALAPEKPMRALRRQRIATVFGDADRSWNEELVLQRYELLWEAGLVPEAPRAARGPSEPVPGQPMLSDHRRILATGIARLRAKIKYRPVIFELMPEAFTFLQLQRTVEAIVGRLLHKQNFRRMIEQQDLIESIGETTIETGGRPAKLLRYKREVVLERASMGSKLPLARTR
jgi:hypothetical protein